MARFTVVGLGRIGLRVLWLLDKLGHDVFGIGISYQEVARAKQLGLEAFVADLFSSVKLLRRQGDPDVVVVALPGAIGFEALRFLVKNGFNVVDVSFFPENPQELRSLIEKERVTVVIDAGVAPGLTNFLLGYTESLEGRLKRAEIYVGGISRKPDPPLGLSPTWSVEDLIEEYTRPARLIRKGRLIALDPLESIEGLFNFPSLGVLEFFPTDGLRTLLETYKDADLLIEYTLRWPGHLKFMRYLKHIGMLSERMLNVYGCPVKPKACLARVIEHGLRKLEDIVVVYVNAITVDDTLREYKTIVYPDNEWSAMAIATGTFQVAVATAVARGIIKAGLNYPEHLGINNNISNYIINFLKDWGIIIDGI